MTIYSDGTVAPCCNPVGRNLPVGNVKNESIKDIWTGNKMSEIRNSFKNNTPSKICKACIDNTSDSFKVN